GRWEAQNFDHAEVGTAAIVWDWSRGSSNFSTLENGIIATHPKGVFIAESSEEDDLASLYVSSSPVTGDADAADADGGDTSLFSTADDETEIRRAFPARTTAVVTRLFAQLPAAALANDL